MITIAALASLVASGCAAFRHESELDAAIAELDALLKEVGGEDGNALVAIAEKISVDSQALLDVQREFSTEFNLQGADRDVQDDSLKKLVSDYEVNRHELRGALLRTQDELHAAVPANSWPDVLEVLNRKSQAIAPRRGMEG